MIVNNSLLTIISMSLLAIWLMLFIKIFISQHWYKYRYLRLETEFKEILAYYNTHTANFNFKKFNVFAQTLSKSQMNHIIEHYFTYDELFSVLAEQYFLKSKREKIARIAADESSIFIKRRVSALRLIALSSLQEKYNILQAGLESKNQHIIMGSLNLLGHINNPESTKILLDKLNSESIHKSRFIRQLEENPFITIEDIAPMLSSPNKDLRYWAVVLIGTIAHYDKSSIYLLNMIDDAEPKIRKAAIKAMTKQQDVHLLIAAKKLIHDESFFVRIHALNGLAQFLDHDTIATIQPLRNDPHHLVRSHANSIILHYDKDSILNPYRPESLVPQDS